MNDSPPNPSKDLRSILLVDDSHENRSELAVYLRRQIGCVVLEASEPDEARKTIENEDINLLITSLLPPDKKGLELLRQTKKTNPEVVVLIGIPVGDREAVTESLRLGAFMYLNFPYDPDEAIILASRALAYHDLRNHPPKTEARLRKSEGFHGIIGRSAKMQKLFDLIEKVAADDTSTVLIQGESGTGKELVAQVLHANSPRRDKSLVPVNCAAIPDELLESELFGYVKGAFTGASQSKMGRIQYADGGSLFLDEIGDMKPNLQAKLLRVLQEKEFEPVGGLKPIPVDVRIIAATHRDLERLVAEGQFREDLYYRLNVIPVQIPPLRERKDDIPLLIEKFVQIFNRNKKTPLLGFDIEAVTALMDYPWRGNVRELENLVQQMSILHSGETVSLEDLPQKYRAHFESEDSPFASLGSSLETSWAKGRIDFNALINDFENRLILQALSITKGNKKEAARLLNLKRTTLLEKIKKKDIRLPSFKQPGQDEDQDGPLTFP